MKFGVAMVTFNRIKLLKECIEAIESQRYPVDKIVIIDNASTDGTRDYLDTIASKEEKIYVEHEKKNLGGSYGFYRALEVIKEFDVDWVLIIDDDAIIDKEYIQQISNEISKSDHLAYSGTVMCGEIVLYPHRKKINNRILMTFSNVPEQKYSEDFFSYDLSSFCGLVIKKELIAKIGLPKKEYFIKFDDSEYSLRILKYSEIINVNAAHLDHKITFEPSPKIRTCDWKRYYEIRNNINMGYNYTKCKPVFVIYTIIKSIARLIREIVIYMRYGNRYNSRYAIPMFIQAPIDGLLGKTGKSNKYCP